MSLVRFLPTPSDRMGIIWSLLAVQGAIVLEYGPAGTTHYSMGLYGGLGLRFQNRMFTTHMSEDDVVMGDVTRLEDAIVELDKSYAPKVIFVVASSVTAVIGTDIKGVCRYMQNEVKAKLVAFEQGGFRGDYSIGLAETYKLLVRNLPKKDVAQEAGVYNIIGASAWRYRMASDIWEVKSLLDEALGLSCNACLCCDTSVEELEDMGLAQVNIVLGNEGLAAAKYLQEKFGTPYVYAVPYGYSGTLSFLKQVGDAVGREPDSMVLLRLQTKEKSLSRLSLFTMMGNNKPKKAVVKGDYDLVQGVSAFLEQGGITVLHKMCAHSLKAIAEPAAAVEAYAEESDWLQVIRGLHDTLILADDVALLQAEADNTKVLISAPFMNSAVANHLPFMGEKGADFLLEHMQAYCRR
ncbi:nitrogenase component 1 [Phascolarctobacterium sp. Marseille-Q4147]|uniref:nitrogenase component 1 n=1 Tax=Phascolarctobacterium sp. Marseille-Q4147 TaxID=2823317 RepID=UPI001B337515|nr:nitrogenase component 1 [Phascolarctobacterium sp. Marseille-Q4147]QTV77853.1 nitrogenase component 1 [Phascolarctobacterium sp. Marseille-Q4147]